MMIEPGPVDDTVIVVESSWVGGVSGGLPVAVAVTVQIPVMKPVTLAELGVVAGLVVGKPGIRTGLQVEEPTHSPIDNVPANPPDGQKSELESTATAAKNFPFIVIFLHKNDMHGMGKRHAKQY
jgi:hypothetical protein